MNQIGILQGRLTKSKGRGIQFFPTENWRNEFEIAKKIGFTCMELLVKKDSFKENPLWSLDGINELNRLADLTGVKIISAHLFYEKTDDYVQKLGHLILSSSLVGVKNILIPFFDQNALIDKEEKMIARQQLNAVRHICKKTNIRLGIETEMPAKELLDFILSFRNPRIGAYYDIGNMASVGVDLAYEISLLNRYIFGVHIKDRLGYMGETVILGNGCADFMGAFRALRKINYKGPYIIHGARNTKIDDIALNKRYFQFAKQLLKEAWDE